MKQTTTRKGRRPGTTKTRKKAPAKSKRTPRSRKPSEMTVDEWQIALRREFGREQDFKLKNIGNEPIFSEFLVTNPASGGTYKVAIRGQRPGENYCSCPDFAVNALGTCKHVEFALAKLERKRGAKKAFQEGFLPSYSSVFLSYGAQREVRFRPGKDCPSALLDHAAEFFDDAGVLLPKSYARFHKFIRKAPLDGHDLRCYEDALQFIARVRDDIQRRERVAKAFPKGTLSPGFKKLLKANLYPYQRKGILFAAKAGRCLLADDMGLGKTIQAIGAVEVLAKSAGVERILVIAPTAVKHQWKHEIERFSGRSVEVIEGLLPQRSAQFRSPSFYKITNYEVVHTDRELIDAWAPDVIILDEAQRIKNWKTRRARAVKQLASEHAIVLTGTPLENRLEELHSIVEFVDQFHLGPLFRFLHEHQHVDDTGRIIGYKNLSDIARTLEPILIRRTKDEVLKELPERVDQHLFVPMTDEQWKHHNENEKMVGEIVAKWKRRGFLTEKEQRMLMVGLQNMRMSCNSTYLLDETTDHGMKVDEFAALAEDILEEPDTKIVVFSQWLRTHKLLSARLDAMNCGHVFYHGGLSRKKRNDGIREFKENADARVFLSTDAGGVGLNLQNASVVINMDQPWNPAVLEQRIARVHRLGQKDNVRVVNFVAQGTIEHGMLDVLAFKKSVFSGVLDGGEDEVFLGGTKLKKFMDTVDNVTGNIPESMPAQAEEPPPEDTAANEEVSDEAAASEREAAERQQVHQQQDAWSDLISTGLDFVGKLGQALQAGTPEGPSQDGKVAPGLLARDEKTGETYLKLPVPDPETVTKVMEVLGGLAEALQGGIGAKKGGG
jgi:superfamily II DNA or RNA helicase